MKNLFTLVLIFSTFALRAQDTTGLVGHWNMNGNTNDTSGHGNNGIGNNLTPAIGQDGVMGDAWYFNGYSSSINVPYNPDMNLSNFSICATIEVMGYYAGTCHGNMILCRGTSGSPAYGTYEFLFSDQPAGYGCSAGVGGIVDSAQENICVGAGASGTGLSAVNGFPAFDSLPYIAKGVWYNVVVTFNDTMYKIYINGVLTDTVGIATPGVPMGTSTNGLSIGDCQTDSAEGYPYFFHGNIDDICLYNRVLSDSEVVLYGNITSAVPAVNYNTAISIYPNPATTQLTISSAYDELKQITITNVIGQAVYSRQFTLSTRQEQVDIAALPTGVYFAKVNLAYRQAGGDVIRKFVKE